MNPQQPHQAYPQPGMPMQKFPQMEPQPERQTCAFVISIITILSSLYVIYQDLSELMIHPTNIAAYLQLLGHLILLIFHILIVSNKDYLKGKPSPIKIIPVFISSLLRIAAMCLVWELAQDKSTLINEIGYSVLTSVISYFAYTSDDDSKSSWLALKPWIHRRPEVVPAYGQYPPQGYPPQQPR